MGERECEVWACGKGGSACVWAVEVPERVIRWMTLLKSASGFHHRHAGLFMQAAEGQDQRAPAASCFCRVSTFGCNLPGEAVGAELED